jgi:hypothetical protein
MDARLHEIYSRYNTELKPLIADQETRMSAFEEPLLLNLSKMFDFLSQAQTREEGFQNKLEEMDNVLSTCISQSYMYIATAIKDDIKQFEKNNGGTIRIKLEKGTFSSAYENLKDEIRKIDKRCKKNQNDYVSHIEDYKESYLKCLELEQLIEEVNDTETLLHSSKGSWRWTLVGWCLSIFTSLWAGKYAVMYVTKIWEAAQLMLNMQ